MKMVIIDTNIIIRFLVRDSPILSKKAKEIFLNQNDILILDCVLLEVLYVLKSKIYNVQKVDGLNMIRKLKDYPNIHLENRELIELFIDIYKKNNISAIDSYLVARNHLKMNRVLTFDNKLKKLLI